MAATAVAVAALSAVAACSSSGDSGDSGDKVASASSTIASNAPVSRTTSTAASSSPSAASSSSSTPSTDTSSSSGTTAGAEGIPSVDACTVLSDEDVVAAGGKAGVHSPTSFDGGPGCDYGVVTLYWIQNEGYFTFGDQQPVSGLGDQAFYSSNLHYIRARKGAARFQVQCIACQGDEQPTLTTLAQKVLAKLP